MNAPDHAPVHAPHIPLTDYYRNEQDRQAYLRKIFDNTAADYDRIEAMLAREPVRVTGARRWFAAV